MNAPRRSAGPFTTSTVVCPMHGLRFDPSQTSGCNRCRAFSSPPPRQPTTRRALLLGAASVVGLGAAAYSFAPWPFGATKARDGGLDIRRLQTKNTSGRSGSYFIPDRAAGSPLPLLVFLHGTHGSGQDGVRIFAPLGRDQGFAVCAPDSRVDPDGADSWEVGDRPGLVTDDRRHVMACIAELVAGGLSIDTRRVLVVGHSGGGSSAPYLATNEEPFTAFAVLHGGAFPGGFGKRRVRGWFSTGSQDNIRPPDVVRSAYEEARSPVSPFEMHVFEGGHPIGDEERRAVVAWWLAG